MAGTVVVNSDKVYAGTSGKTETRELTILCTGDASGGAIDDTDLCNIAGLTESLHGWGLYLIETVPGAPGPDDDTDLYLKTANGTDLLEGNGVDGIDNAANNLIYPPLVPLPVFTTLTLDVDNQTVNSAVYSIILYLMR